MRRRGLGGRPGPRLFISACTALALLLGSGACVVEDRPVDESSPDRGVSGRVDAGRTEGSAPGLEGIRAMLDASAASWNSGDLDGFIDDYTDDPALAFVGSSGVMRGIAEVRARYESGYWAGGGPADSLRFEDLELTPLGDAHALAMGRYVLYRPASGGTPETVTSTGWFSLVVARDGGRWRIIHDHSSELEGG